MGTVTVLTSDRVYQIEANSVTGGAINGSGQLILSKPGGVTVDAGNVDTNSVVGGHIDGSGHLILEKPAGVTVDAGSVGSVVDTTNLRLKKNDTISLTGAANDVVETATVNDDGTDTSTWVNRLVYQFLPVGGSARKTTFLNEYGELRVAPAKENTTGARFYAKETPTNPSAARDLTVPVVELMDDRITRTSLRGWLGDGATTRRGIKMSDVLVLGATDPVPANTPPGTVILRTSSAPALNANTGFETNLVSWTGAGGTFTRDTTLFHTGVASAKMVATGGVPVTITADKVPIAAGNTYRTSGWLRCSVATTVNLNLAWFNASNTLLSTALASLTVAANTWASIASSFVAPTGATQASIVPTLPGTPTAGVTFNVDDILLTP